MSLDATLNQIMRAAKFGAIGDQFTTHITGQGTFSGQDFAPDKNWFQNLLVQGTGFNISNLHFILASQNELGFAYGSIYSWSFDISDEFSGADATKQTVTDQLGAAVAPYFDDFMMQEQTFSITPIGGGGGGNVKQAPIHISAPGNTPGGTKTGGVFTQIANDLKIPLSALGIIGVALIIYFEGRK